MREASLSIFRSNSDFNTTDRNLLYFVAYVLNGDRAQYVFEMKVVFHHSAPGLNRRLHMRSRSFIAILMPNTNRVSIDKGVGIPMYVWTEMSSFLPPPGMKGDSKCNTLGRVTRS